MSLVWKLTVREKLMHLEFSSLFLVLDIYFSFFVLFFFFFATGMFVHAHARCTPDDEMKLNKCRSLSRWPIILYFSYQGEAFLCLPCPSTGITLWLPGVPCFSLRWPSWSEPSVAADNTWPPRRASCQWPITALHSASSILTGRPVWPPLGWSRSWQWGWTAGTDTAPSAEKKRYL